MRSKPAERLVCSVALGVVVLALAGPGTAARTAPGATLATFAGRWLGHTRDLTIKRSG